MKGAVGFGFRLRFVSFFGWSVKDLLFNQKQAIQVVVFKDFGLWKEKYVLCLVPFLPSQE